MPDVAVRPDARKSLVQLKDEWVSCAKCDLGLRRVERDGHFVFGEGANHAVMFVGEGPGVDEEQRGIPFVGRSGQLLRRILKVLQIQDFYLTNIVCCRSCALQTDPSGAPMMYQDRRTKVMKPRYKDEPPTPPQKNACRARLMEEIYLVDPVVIVGLGGPACEALLGHPITITRDRGETTQIAIPGASYRPVLTEKRQQWVRKVGGEWQAPVEQNEVLYHFIPTLHPAYVIRELADKGPNNPFQRFVSDLRKAKQTYEAYLEAVFGAVSTAPEAFDEEDLHANVESENE